MVAEKRRFQSRSAGNSFRATHLVEEHPLSSVTIMFGLGVGVGLLVGTAIVEAGRRVTHHDTLAEKLTCQIRDVLKNALPEGLSRHFS